MSSLIISLVLVSALFAVLLMLPAILLELFTRLACRIFWRK